MSSSGTKEDPGKSGAFGVIDVWWGGLVVGAHATHYRASRCPHDSVPVTPKGLTGIPISLYNEFARKGRRANTNAGRLLLHLRKEVRTVRITFHIGRYTVTIIVYERKKSNRHSGK